MSKVASFTLNEIFNLKICLFVPRMLTWWNLNFIDEIWISLCICLQDNILLLSASVYIKKFSSHSKFQLLLLVSQVVSLHTNIAEG